MPESKKSLPPGLLLILPLGLLALFFWGVGVGHKSEASVSPAASVPTAGAVTQEVLSAEKAAAYTPLSFDDAFVVPAGPQGLEYTSKIKALAGKLVAMTGYMVRNYGPDPSVFVFSDYPRIHNEVEEGLADSLPPGLLHVTIEIRPGDAPAWRPEKMTVYGQLELGPRRDLNGRISYMRLTCDFITDASTGNFLEVRKPTVLQRERLGISPSSSADTNGGSPIFFQPRRKTNQTPDTTPSK